MYGIRQRFVELINTFYDHATELVQMIEFLAGHMPIQNGLRQSCPLSVVFFALCLQPHLRALEDYLPGINFEDISNTVLSLRMQTTRRPFRHTPRSFHHDPAGGPDIGTGHGSTPKSV